MPLIASISAIGFDPKACILHLLGRRAAGWNASLGKSSPNFQQNAGKISVVLRLLCLSALYDGLNVFPPLFFVLVRREGLHLR